MIILKMLKVPYFDEPIPVFEKNQVLYADMKYVVEMLGLVWWPQRQKIKNRFAKRMIVEDLPISVDKTKKAICLDLGSIPIWLYTINTSHVKPELRNKIEECQEECDNALASYMFTSEAKRP